MRKIGENINYPTNDEVRFLIEIANLLVVAEENRPEKVHNLIYRMVGDLNAPKLLKELRKIDSFNEKYLKGEKLGILKR